MGQWRRKWQYTQDSILENLTEKMKRHKDMTPEHEPTRLEGVQYATGEEQTAITNNSRENKVVGPKGKIPSAVDVSGGKNKA